jgi:hypothetical protein
MISEIDLSNDECRRRRMWENINKKMKCKNYIVIKDNFPINNQMECKLYKTKKKFLRKTTVNIFVTDFHYDRNNFEITFYKVSMEQYNEIYCICELLNEIDGLKVILRKNFC